MSNTHLLMVFFLALYRNTCGFMEDQRGWQSYLLVICILFQFKLDILIKAYFNLQFEQWIRKTLVWIFKESGVELDLRCCLISRWWDLLTLNFLKTTTKKQNADTFSTFFIHDFPPPPKIWTSNWRCSEWDKSLPFHLRCTNWIMHLTYYTLHLETIYKILREIKINTTSTERIRIFPFCWFCIFYCDSD